MTVVDSTTIEFQEVGIVGNKSTPLMQCPNFKVCQTMVHANKRGEAHKYGVYDRDLDKIVYRDCNGSG